MWRTPTGCLRFEKALQSGAGALVPLWETQEGTADEGTETNGVMAVRASLQEGEDTQWPTFLSVLHGVAGDGAVAGAGGGQPAQDHRGAAPLLGDGAVGGRGNACRTETASGAMSAEPGRLHQG